jgi:hypothetical protein
VRNTHYPNYLEWVTKIWVGLITRETPGRHQYPDQVMEWSDEATLEGDSLDTAISEEIFPWWLCYGEMYALVQGPPPMPDGIEPVSAAQETGKVYLSTIHPDRVMEAPYMPDGELAYLKYWADLPPSPDPLREGDQQGKRIWVLSREGWWYYDVPDDHKGTHVPVADSGMWDTAIAGTVPVAVMRSREYRQAPIFYLAQTMLRLFNVLSMLGESEDFSCFPILAWPTPGGSPDHIKELNLGSSTVATYDEDKPGKPMYVSYDNAPLEHLVARVESLVKEAKHLGALLTDNNVGATGVAKAYSFLQTDQTIVSFVSTLERFDSRVAHLASLWLGAGDMPEEADPAYPRSFDVQEVTEALEAAHSLLDMQVGPVVTRLTKRFAINKVHQNLSSDERQEIDDELEEEAEAEPGADLQPMLPQQEPGFPGQPGQPPVPPKPRVEVPPR